MFAYTIDSPDPRVRVEIHYDEETEAPWNSMDMLASFAHSAGGWQNHVSAGENDPASVYLSPYSEMGDTLAETVRELRFEGYTVIPFRIDDYGSSGTQVNECEPGDATSIAYVSRRKLADEYGDDKSARRKARSVIRSELAVVQAWANGDVYGYVVREAQEDDSESLDGYGEVLESVWGFIEPDHSERYVETEARTSAEWEAQKMNAETTEARAMAERDIVTV